MRGFFSGSTKHVDRPLLIAVLVLVLVGFLVFSSAALGVLARGADAPSFSSLALRQGIGIVLGLILLTTLMRVHYRLWRRYALAIFIGSILLTLLVFVPGLGFEAGGAQRWLAIGPITLQPAEFLKLGFVVYLAAWLTSVRAHIHKWQYGIVPLLGLLAIVAALLLLQPDTGTFLVIGCAAGAMYIAAGAKVRDIILTFLIGAFALAGYALARPYVAERILTFLNPTLDPLGAGYQIQQSLIAIGSGELFGRGFGQSIQKFNYLPEPIGDSVFAVAAEEFGFVGSFILIALFVFIGLRGLKIAVRAPDYFGGLLAAGITILILAQSFINISAMLGLVPLTGMPLLFVSHGGSAIALALAQVGILLNISRYGTAAR